MLYYKPYTIEKSELSSRSLACSMTTVSQVVNPSTSTRTASITTPPPPAPGGESGGKFGDAQPVKDKPSVHSTYI